jgi:hypothetical protein
VRQVQALPFGLQSVHGGGFTAVWGSAAVGALGCSRSHFDLGCFAAVAGTYGLVWVVVRCFSAGVCGGGLFRGWRVWWRAEPLNIVANSNWQNSEKRTSFYCYSRKRSCSNGCLIKDYAKRHSRSDLS